MEHQILPYVTSTPKYITFSCIWTIQDLPGLFDFTNPIKSFKFPEPVNDDIKISLFKHDAFYFQSEVYFSGQTAGKKKKVELSINNSKTVSVIISDTYTRNTSVKFYGLKEFTVQCTVRILDTVVHKFTKLQIPACKLVEDLKNLSVFKEFNLTITTADGKSISANKDLLSARSKVFAAMFQHDTKENRENRIEIDDFSHEVVTEMIVYICTGVAPNLSEMAEELIGIADKYELERLKKLCEVHIAENISVENALTVLKLADLYRANTLRSISIAFMKNNLTRVMKTPEWKATIGENLVLILNTCFLKEETD